MLCTAVTVRRSAGRFRRARPPPNVVLCQRLALTWHSRCSLITITSMVLISIHPFAFKKFLLLVATLLCLSSALCFADSIFMSLHSTPYGRQLNRIQLVPLSVPERTVQPPFLVACQSLDRRFARNFGWILPGTFNLDPTSNWLTHRSEEVEVVHIFRSARMQRAGNTTRLPRPSTQQIDGSVIPNSE